MAINLLKREGWGGTFDVSVSNDDRAFHTYVIGKTGVGKSTFLKQLLTQEIQNGAGVGLIDPHGDLATELLEHIPRTRFQDVVYFNPADPTHSAPLNILKASPRPDLVASSVVGALRNIWIDSWGPRLEYILYASVAALAECENTTLLGIPRLLTSEAYRYWVIHQVTDPLVRQFWTSEFEMYDKRFRNEATAPLLNKVGQFLLSPILRNILGQVRNRFSFEHLLNNRQIFIANLSKGLIGEEKSSILGSFLVSQFELAGMARASQPAFERQSFALYIDEFQNFATDSFTTILSEARKYGLSLTLSHQHLSQLRPSIRDSVLGNVASLICFRVGHTDAEVLSAELGPECQPGQLTELDRFEVMAKVMADGRMTGAFAGRTNPPNGEPTGRSEALIRYSNERFTVPQRVVEDRITRWLEHSF
jgi:hypothetical protein